MHDPGAILAELKQTLTRDRLAIALLLGAGCPVSVTIEENEKTRPLIPAIAGLTAEVRSHVTNDVAYKASFDTILEQFTKDGTEDPTVEQLLTRIRSLREIAGTQSIVGITGDQLERLDTEITEYISVVVGKSLPAEPNAYHWLASWVKGIPRHVPVELYTTNYDTLLEQAFDVNKAPYFDGFVGAKHPFFDPISIESDVSPTRLAFPARWARLWKIHGSINWWQVAINGKDRIVRADSVQGGKRRLIHPSHLKYEESRRMPYLALIDRFRKFISNGPAALVVCGFSFRDNHINETLNQALEANPNSVCFALMNGVLANYQEAREIANRLANLNLLARDRAIINRHEAPWMITQGSDTRVIDPFCNIKRKEDKTVEEIEFLLGQFDRFGHLLSQLAADRAR